jgi:hypothetical protein
MTYDDFQVLCENTSVHPDSSELPTDPLLLSLWHDRRGHWVIAHRIAQSVKSAGGNALHAYLHREEGDHSNAQYWYSRAERPMPDVPLEDEWEALAREFCENT